MACSAQSSDSLEYFNGHWGITFVDMKDSTEASRTTYRGVRSLGRMQIDTKRGGDLENSFLIWRYNGESYRRLAELQINENNAVKLKWLDGASELLTLELMIINDNQFELRTLGGYSNVGIWQRIIFEKQPY